MELKAFEYELPVHLIFGAGKAECIGKEVKKYGKNGKINAKWVYGIAVINESGKESTYTWKKEGIYLVDKVCKKISTGYPLNSITKYTKNNKYLAEITEEEKEAMKQDEQDVVNFIAENI